MNLDIIAGNDRTKELLSSMLDTGHLPHCILIDGPQGSGKSALAHLIAKAVLCRGPDPAALPCGECLSCAKMDKGIHPDFLEITGTGASGGFPVETVRGTRSDIFIVPSESERKVVFFRGADTMSEQSQNALLTVLEEPPSYALFIISCRSASALLPTIRSRATRLQMSSAQDADALSFPEGEPHGQGDAGIIGQTPGEDGAQTAEKPRAFCVDFVQNLLQPDELALLLTCAVLEKDRVLCRETLPLLRGVFRDAIRRKNGVAAHDPLSVSLAQKLSLQRLLQLIEALDMAETALARNIHGALYATWLPAMARDAAGL